MDELNALTEWVKTEKGITKITLEDLMELVPEYELRKLVDIKVLNGS
jgi:hypothetical protein